MPKLVTVLDFLFGCHHLHLSRVFTISGQTYRVCCDCGARYGYSLETMSIKRRLPGPCTDKVSNCVRNHDGRQLSLHA